MFCESFLEYVHRHPLLQRAIISRYHDDQDDDVDYFGDVGDGDDDNHEHYDSDKQPGCGGLTLSPSPLSVTVFYLKKGEKSVFQSCFSS